MSVNASFSVVEIVNWNRFQKWNINKVNKELLKTCMKLPIKIVYVSVGLET